jgi:outer membrane lipoprotein SlyB
MNLTRSSASTFLMLLQMLSDETILTFHLRVAASNLRSIQSGIKTDVRLKMNQLSKRTMGFRTRAALAVAVVAMFGTVPAVQAAPSGHGTAKHCTSCGTVISTHTYQRAGHGSGLGVAGGAVVGGLLGNQIGGGTGRTLATVAGAVGGGYAGNEIEKNARKTTATQVRVRMENGSVRSFTESGGSRWHSGQHVRVRNGALTSRG